MYLLFLIPSLVFLSGTLGQQGQGQGQGGLSSLSFSDQPRLASAVQELSSITQRRAGLQADALRYRQTLARLRRQRQELAAGCNCGDNTFYAFNAFLEKDVSNFGQKMTVPFSNVTLNTGNAYDVRHAAFRAPHNGTYQFTVAMGVAATHEISVVLVRNGTPLINIRTSSDYTWRMLTNSVVVELQTGDDVWVQHGTTSDANHVYVGDKQYTTFSGHILSAH